MIIPTRKGSYCPDGDFYIDPICSVSRAIITHGHYDHARRGHEHILCSERSKKILDYRLKPESIQTLRFGETIKISNVNVTLYPASHILGASQIKIESAKNGIWLYTGDFRVTSDSSCDDFENVKTDFLVSESTFGLPVFRWPDQKFVFESFASWWLKNVVDGVNSILYCYSLGKAQRVLVGLKEFLGEESFFSKIFCHDSIYEINKIYLNSGIKLPDIYKLSELKPTSASLILLPPSCLGMYSNSKLGSHREAMMSGWMMIRGYSKRQQNCQRFVLSDHADWNQINNVVKSSFAEQIYLLHGYTDTLAKHLCEQGFNAESFYKKHCKNE